LQIDGKEEKGSCSRSIVEKRVCCKGKIRPEKTKREKKVETPVLSVMGNILLEFGMTATDCCELIKLAKTIFEHFKAGLLSVSHPSRCNDNIVVHVCDLHRDICVTLDLLMSKLRMKNGEPQDSNYVVAEKKPINLHYLWSHAKLAKDSKSVAPFC
jgi:hypothetical protein